MTAAVIRSDARTLPLADSSVDLIVTSPPYFGLRSYQDGGEHYAGQVGDEATPAEFVDALIACTREWMRVLKPSGSLWVNLGDKYSGAQQQNSGRQSSVSSADYWRRTDPKRTGIPNKSLIGIPWRYALRCIDELGLILRAEVIWSKPNGLPESVTDRVRRSHEQWFHFTLEPRYFSAVDEVREPVAPAGLARRAYAYSVTDAQRAGNNPVLNGAGMRPANDLGKLPGSVWQIPTQPLQVPAELGVDHFAAFPMEWPRRIIQGWSPSGVCVECGEGLRPVMSKEGARPVARAHRHLPGYTDPAGEGVRDMTYRIEGYTCSCPTRSTPSATASERTTAPSTPTTKAPPAAAADTYPSSIRDATVPTRPAVILDAFGGTGTTALVASALGRIGISVDLSHDYCRLARWRTTDRGQIAAAMQVEKPPKQVDGQDGLFEVVA